MYPMFKKNPFMSAWLSGANSAAGGARGFWLAEMQRQQAAMMQAATEQMIRFWSGAWLGQPGSAAQPSRHRGAATSRRGRSR